MAEGKRLKKDLADHKRIGIDTTVFIHHFEADELSDLTALLLARVQDGHCTGIVSALTVAELLAKPMESGVESLADLYRLLFHEMPHLQTVALDQEVAFRSAAVKAEQGFSLVDSILLATALESGATAFVTDRAEISEARGLQVILLGEYL